MRNRTEVGCVLCHSEALPLQEICFFLSNSCNFLIIMLAIEYFFIFFSLGLLDIYQVLCCFDIYLETCLYFFHDYRILYNILKRLLLCSLLHTATYYYMYVL